MYPTNVVEYYNISKNNIACSYDTIISMAFFCEKLRKSLLLDDYNQPLFQ